MSLPFYFLFKASIKSLILSTISSWSASTSNFLIILNHKATHLRIQVLKMQLCNVTLPIDSEWTKVFKVLLTATYISKRLFFNHRFFFKKLAAELAIFVNAIPFMHKLILEYIFRNRAYKFNVQFLQFKLHVSWNIKINIFIRFSFKSKVSQ